MIRFQVVDLLAEDQCPKVLAQELDDVERFDEARLVFGESRWLCAEFLTYMDRRVGIYTHRSM